MGRLWCLDIRCSWLGVGDHGGKTRIPLIALGLGLQSTGYDIRVIVDENYEWLVKQYGLDYVSIKGIEHMLSNGKVWDRLEDCRHACYKSDAIVFSPHTFSFIGYHIAEKLDIQNFWAASFPMHPVKDK